MQNKEIFILPVEQLSNTLNEEVLKLMGGIWQEAAGYYIVRRKAFELSQYDWKEVWRRYPGPVMDDDCFYTNDPSLREVTTEQLMKALKLLEVEQRLERGKS